MTNEVKEAIEYFDLCSHDRSEAWQRRWQLLRRHLGRPRVLNVSICDRKYPTQPETDRGRELVIVANRTDGLWLYQDESETWHKLPPIPGEGG